MRRPPDRFWQSLFEELENCYTVEYKSNGRKLVKSESDSESPDSWNGEMGKKVVIVGGGFAGLNAAKCLANSDSLEVTLIDRKNYHLFQPLLYQVATAGLNPADIGRAHTQHSGQESEHSRLAGKRRRNRF